MAAIESPFKSVTTYNTIANTCMECKTCWMPFKININIPQDQLQDTYQAWLILAQINGLSDLKTRFTQSSDNVLSPMRLPEQRLAFIPVFTRLWIHTTRHRKHGSEAHMQTRRLLLRAPPWFSNTVPTTHGVKQPTSVTAMMGAASAEHPSSSVTATREGRNAPGDRSREQLGWLMSKHNNICTINHTTPERHSQPLPNANAGAAPPVNDNRTTRCERSGV